MQLGRIRSTVDSRDPYQYVFRVGFGVFHEDVEVSIFIEDAGVEELILHVVFGTSPVRLYQIGIGIRRLRILVEVLHIRVCGRAVEVEVILLHILSVITFAVGQSEQPLLENWIFAIPQGQGEAETLVIIGNTSEAVLAPAVGARTGLIVCKKIPGVTILAIILADRAPLALA